MSIEVWQFLLSSPPLAWILSVVSIRQFAAGSVSAVWPGVSLHCPGQGPQRDSGWSLGVGWRHRTIWLPLCVLKCPADPPDWRSAVIDTILLSAGGGKREKIKMCASMPGGDKRAIERWRKCERKKISKRVEILVKIFCWGEILGKNMEHIL